MEKTEPVRETDLYRFYDKRGRLLYVGVSYNALTRMQSHMKEKSWFKDVCDITIERFESREAAVTAEEAAIKTEMPMHNGVHKPTIREHILQPQPMASPLEQNISWDDAGELLIGAPAIAKALGITARQTYRLIYAEDIPTFKLGGSVAARRSTLTAWLAEQERNARAAA